MMTHHRTLKRDQAPGNGIVTISSDPDDAGERIDIGDLYPNAIEMRKIVNRIAIAASLCAAMCQAFLLRFHRSPHASGSEIVVWYSFFKRVYAFRTFLVRR